MLNLYKYHTQPQLLDGYKKLSMLAVCNAALEKINHKRWDRGRDPLKYTFEEVNDDVHILDAGGQVIGKIVKIYYEADKYQLYTGDKLYLSRVDASDPFDQVVSIVYNFFDVLNTGIWRI
jgi:hypothetical protein